MGLFNLIKQTMLMKNDEKLRIGLSQFSKKNTAEEITDNTDFSIRRKDVKLSDLMRRTNSY